MPMNPRTLRPYRKAAPPPSGTPASLLLHFDGDFTDSSPNGLAATGYGDAAVSSTETKFGSGAAYFDQSGDYAVVVPSSPELDFGAGDFTIEFWTWVGSTSGVQVIWSRWNNSGDNVAQVYLVDSTLYFGTTLITPAIGTLVANQWQHIALTRSSGTLSAFVDGVKTHSTTYTASLDSTSSFVLGANDIGSGGANWFGGYIDDLRIVKGLAVYDGDFVPPTAALSVNASPYTNYKPYGALLFSECQSGDLVGTYADGAGGRYTETISTGSC